MAENFFADIEGAAAQPATPAVATPAPSSGMDFFSDFAVEEAVDAPEVPSLEQGFMARAGAEWDRNIGEIGQLADVAQGGLQRSGAAAVENLTRLRSPLAESVVRQVGALESLFRGDMQGVADSVSAPLKAVSSSTASKLRSSATTNAQSGEQLNAALEDRSWLERELGGGLVDVAGSPSSALSIVGGPAGLIAVGDVYAQTYSEAIERGLPPEEAEQYAWTQAAPESIAFIPAGQLLERVPIVGKFLKKKAADASAGVLRRLANPNVAAAATIARTAVGEAVEESTTGALQDVANIALAGQEASKKIAQLAGENAPTSLEDFVGRRYRDARAGLIMGGGLSAPFAVGRAAAEFEQGVAARTEQVASGIEKEVMDRRATAAEQQAAPDLAPAPATVEADTEAAFAEQEQVREDQIEAEFRNEEIRKQAAAAPDNAMAQAFAARPPWTPEMVAAERARSEAPAPAPTPTPTETAPETAAAPEPTQAPREAVATPATTEDKATRNAGIGAIKQAQRQLGLDDATYRELLKTTTGKDSAAKLNAEERAKVVSALNERGANVTATPPAPKPKAKPGTIDAELDAMTTQLGLDQPLAMSGEAGADTAFDPDTFRTKARGIAEKLARSNRQQDVDVLNLIKQRKLVIAPNPDAIARGERTAAGSGAEYDPADGTMYIYSDRLDTDNVAEVLAAAHHEAGHAGQFNDREGRPDILRYMLGNKELDNANRRIRKAADSGNRVAQEAINLAREAAGEDADLESLEVVPYLATAVARNRGGTLGSIGGVWTDVNAGLRKFGREKLGMKSLDFDINELMQASQQTSGEIVATDTKGRKTDAAPLEMVIPARAATGGQEAEDAGRVYSDPVDGERKFVISDQLSDVTQNPDKLRQIKNNGAVLSQVLSHPELYKQIPDLRGVRVTALKGQDALMYGGVARPELDEISINPGTIDSAIAGDPRAKDLLRSVLLHEAQHIVQFKGEGSSGGSAAVFYTEADQQQVRRLSKLTRDATDAANAFLATMEESLPSDSGLVGYATSVAENVLDDPDLYSRHQLSKAEDMVQAGARVETQQATVDVINAKYHDQYLQIQGEREAYWTEQNKNKALENLPINPTVIPEAEGGLPGSNETAFVTTRDERGRMSVSPSQVASAQTIRQPTELDDFAELAQQSPPPSPQVNTPAFKEWFGDSKIVDENGNPAVWWRGNRSGNTTFRLNPKGLLFAAPARNVASGYTIAGENPWDSGGLFPIYIRAENPMDYDNPKHINAVVAAADTDDIAAITPRQMDRMAAGDWDTLENSDVIAAIKAAGFDGFYVMEEGSKNIAVFSPNAMKSATDNSGEFSRTNNNILAMAAPTGGGRTQSNIPVWLKGVFTSSQGTGRVINEIAEHAASSPAAARMEAENYMGKYRAALGKLATRRGVNERALSEAITKAIDSVDKTTDTYEENFAAFRAAVKPFGEVGQILIDMRNSVDAMSLDILRLRASQGKPLTKAERKTYTTIKNNMGRYAHREFATHMRNTGYADTIWNDWLASQDKDKKGKLNDAQRSNAKRVANALSRLVDDVRIPADAVLTEMDADQVRRLHDTWTSSSNPDALSTQQKVDELASMRDRINGDKDVLQRQAETIAQEILGIMPETRPLMQKLGYTTRSRSGDASVIANYYRGGKQDQGIFIERENISPEIRDLMGEIKDPAMRMFTSAAKQAEFVARTKMLLELSSVNDPYHVQPPGPAGRPEVKGMKQLTGDAYGPMENYYVSPELNNLISDQIEQLANFEAAVAMAAKQPSKLTNKAIETAIEKWGKVAGLTKMLQIVYKPANFLFNFMGGPRMMLMNGNVNPATLKKAVNTASELIAYARNPTKGGALARRVNAMGVTDSAFIGEITSEQYRELRNVVDQMVGKDPGKIREILRKSNLTAKETYAMADVTFKIANFYHQAENVLPAYYKAANIKRTQEQIDREAADIVSRTNITYKRAAPIIKAAERGGFTQFGTYFYEVFRTEVANLNQGLDELQRAIDAPNAKAAAIMRAQAAKRIGGQALSWALTGAVTQALGAATFGDDEEDKMIRNLLPPFLRNQDFVKAGEAEDGEPVLMEWSRFDPAGPATDIMRRILNDEVGPKDIAEELFSLYIAPRLGTRLIIAGAATLGVEERSPTKPISQQLFPNAYEHVLETGDVAGLSDRATKAWTTVGETFLPGWIDALKTNNVSPKSADDPMAALATMMRYGGATMYKPDAKRQLESAAFDYKDTLSRERKLLGELVDNRPNMDSTTALEKVADAKAAEMKAWIEMRNVYRGMVAANIPEERRAVIMKEAFSRKVSGEVASQIMSGEFQSVVVSESSFNSLKSNAVKKLPEDKREAAEKRWDQVWQLLNGEADGND